ncbi:hypothetical protein CQ010_11665 [Arthrobacter sp. MYb211]|uniref:maleylpyruvate isomerase family mycothiol-dependent enzyme n=1 Tax=unclassified Arthrobacter TaxID=235627 RepID=UPI000CFBC9D3|nr:MULTISPECIES: maleylpyruvate isomerase family mycothiol-dependent enzyme [unclassified Arthrobacter]PRA10846.1 hypothetical protein CQ015_12375 [Arthrobacter sp. MYb221]PRC06907.1 hypothetical protein CQ010_11665 [Arthrobacter sp. MYb211]
MQEVWELVHAERKALIDDLSVLSPEQWERPSMCSGWTVHDVAAHLVNNARTTTPGLLLAMLRARFDFDRQNSNGVAEEKGATPQLTLQRLREVAVRKSGPPAPLASRLVEEVAHGEDIRRPLGITRSYPAQAVTAAIRYQTRTSQSFGGAKELAQRVSLVAEDAGVIFGTGPEVRGPALELLMIATAREAREGSLSGPGIELL